MKKNRIYYIIALLLAAITLILILTDQKGTLKHHSKYFAINDTSVISKIMIKNGDKVLELEQFGNNWMVNSKYNARYNQVKGLLKLLSSLQTTAPLPRKLESEASRAFEKKAILVRFESKLEVLKEYEIIELQGPQSAPVIREPGSNDMYFANIPGFDKPLPSLFATQEKFWRDNVVFRYKPWEILNITLMYPQNNEGSFILDLENPEKITITQLGKTKSYNINNESVGAYLAGFSNIPFYYLSAYRKSLTDSLQKVKPYCVFTIKSVENRVVEVKTYTISQSSNPGKLDLNKMYALLQNDSVPVVIKYVDIDPVMKYFKDLIQP